MESKFEIRYALNGGFGGTENKEWEDSNASTLDEAEKDAYNHACEEYDGYDGMHGLRSTEDIMEEDEVNEDEAQDIWLDEREEWLDYEAREKKDDVKGGLDE